MEQLDLGHQSQFPVIITRKLSCDKWVVRLLRQRAYTSLQKLLEQHDESRLIKKLRYMTDSSSFKSADANKLIAEFWCLF